MTHFSLQDTRGPSVAIEIASHRLSGVRLETRGGATVLAAHVSEALPADAVVPSLTAANVHNRAAVTRALARVLEQLGRPRRIGLVIPDPSAKLSMLKFRQVPARASELDQLIRWQVKKAAPFPIEDAQLSYSKASISADGQEYLVAIARRDIVEDYESVCAEIGASAGVVDVSTSSVINAVLAMPDTADRDCLVVNMARDWVSLAVLRTGQVVLLRSRAAEGEETLADLVHQTAMYYEDRLEGTGFSQVFLCGATSGDAADDGAAEGVRRGLEQRLGTPVTAVDPTSGAAFVQRTIVSASAIDALAPAVGLLMRYRGVAA